MSYRCVGGFASAAQLLGGAAPASAGLADGGVAGGADAAAAPAEPPAEKTFLQKYWMYMLPAVVLVSSR